MRAAWLAMLLLTQGLAAQPDERKLVLLRSQGLASWAESHPAFDFTCYLPRRYQLSGVDSALVQAAASSGGVPTRLLGNYQGDRVRVAPLSLQLEPPLLPLSLTVRQPWRGVAALNQGGDSLALVPGQWLPCRSAGGLEAGLYRLTAWTDGGHLCVEDCLRLSDVPACTQMQGPLQAVLSEGFVQKTLDLYRTANPSWFRWQEPGGRAGFELSTLGLTCITGQLRTYASLHGQLNGLGLGKVVEGEWEAPLSVELVRGNARIQARPEGQSLRMVKPLFAEMPSAWTTAVNRLAQRFFSAQLVLPIPGVYLKPLLDRQLVTPEEVDKLQVLSTTWGDRRGSCLVLSQSRTVCAGPPQELAWAVPEGFALGLSAGALNRSFQATIPGMLPWRVALPRDRIAAPRVLIFRLDLKELEIQKLNLSYQRGALRFDPCEVAVAWQLGPLSGLEPGARLTGWAVPSLDKGQVSLKFSIEQFEFLSPQILGLPPEDQQRMRSEILDGLQKVPVPLPIPLQMATPVSTSTSLQITQLRPTDEVLWLVGQWRPN